MNMLNKTGTGALLGGALLIAGGIGLAHAAPPAQQAKADGDGIIDIAVSAGGQQVGIIQNVEIVNAVTLIGSVCPVSGITEGNLNDLDVHDTAVARPCAGAGGLSFIFTQNRTAAAQAQGNGGKATGAAGQSTSTAPSPPKAKPH
ncbi:MAG: hypothetical protein ACR2JM_11025 [Mycobacterium sp.]